MQNDTNTLLQQLCRQNEKQAKALQRLTLINAATALLCLCMVVILLAAGLLLMPRMHTLLNQMQGLTAQLELVMQDLQGVARVLSGADIAGMINSVDDLVEQSRQGVATALEKIEAIDDGYIKYSVIRGY